MKTKKDLNKLQYYIAPNIKHMLDKAKLEVSKKDWDRVYIIDGEEGSGKSLLGLQIGCYLDPTLNLDRIIFTGEEFSRAIELAEKNQCIIFDEAFNGLDSTGAMSKINRLIVRKLMECRQKNLFIIIILPTIFLLQKYAAVFRSKGLFHVYATSKGDRGYYRVYNKLNKKLLYLLGKKLYSYSKPYVKNSYRFYGNYPLDEQKYRNKKLETLNEQKDENEMDRMSIRAGALHIILKDNFQIPYTKQTTMLNELGFTIHQSNVARIVSKTRKFLNS